MAYPLRALADPAADSVRTIRAFHGSPYDFDRFDASKIGTGEGAQSYGHGLYFAGNPKVAEEYRSRLAGVAPMEELVVAGRRLSGGNRWNYSPRNDSIEENVLSTLLENLLLDEHGLRAAGPNAHELAIETLRSRAKHYPEEWPEAVGPAAELEKKLAAPGGVRVAFGQRPGRMYEVDLGHPEGSFLNLDAAVSDQPDAVRSLIDDIPGEPMRDGSRYGGNATVVKDGGRWWLQMDSGTRFGLSDADIARMGGSSASGSHVYQRLANAAGGEPQASQELVRRGIPGAMYFDQASRTAGEGTRNYVIFPGAEDRIRILRKYGLLAPMAAGSADTEQ